jgi:hypothetical protein
MVGGDCGLSFVGSCMCYFKNGLLDQGSVICWCLTCFVRHFGVAACVDMS